jgi:hypothetical protein
VTNEPKPFASLSSGLLARKGGARPAMRPQGFGQGAAGLEDLGWNDMGFEPPKAAEAPRDETHDGFGDDVVEHPRGHPTGLTPVQSPVHTQQAEIAGRLGADDADEPEAAELEETVEIDERAEHYEVEPEPAPKPVRVKVAALPVPAEHYEVEPEPAPKPVPAKVAATPVPTPPRAQQPRSAPGSKSKAAFTLRLDPSRHLRLRLACAVNGSSAQQLVTDALDQLLEHMPELDAMAASAKRKG